MGLKIKKISFLKLLSIRNLWKIFTFDEKSKFLIL